MYIYIIIHIYIYIYIFIYIYIYICIISYQVRIAVHEALGARYCCIRHRTICRQPFVALRIYILVLSAPHCFQTSVHNTEVLLLLLRRK